MLETNDYYHPSRNVTLPNFMFHVWTFSLMVNETWNPSNELGWDGVKGVDSWIIIIDSFTWMIIIDEILKIILIYITTYTLIICSQRFIFWQSLTVERDNRESLRRTVKSIFRGIINTGIVQIKKQPYQSRVM